MSSTLNAADDVFGIETLTQNKVKVVSGDNAKSNQTTSGANTYGDPVAIDKWGDTADPKRDYEIVGDIDSSMFANKGGSIISSPSGFDAPLCFGGLSFSTGFDQIPTLSVSGKLVQANATQLRKYSPIAFKISTRHRAQNCVGTISGSTFTPAIVIKKGNTEADDELDYGLQSVSGDLMPLEIKIAQPKGVTMNHDLHGNIGTVSYTMNWYDGDTPPTIELSSAAQNAGITFSQIPSDDDPSGGYKSWKWAIQFPMIGAENTTSAVQSPSPTA